MTRSLKILMHGDLSFKGITWSRQHLKRRIDAGTFPPPDGRTTDAPTAPMFWFEETIDNYLRNRAKKMKTPPDTS